MTTAEEMIELAARAICVSLDEDPDKTHAKYPDWRGWHQYAGAARAACAVAVEMCAEEADKWSKNPGTISPPGMSGAVHASMVADWLARDFRTWATAIKGE